MSGFIPEDESMQGVTGGNATPQVPVPQLPTGVMMFLFNPQPQMPVEDVVIEEEQATETQVTIGRLAEGTTEGDDVPIDRDVKRKREEKDESGEKAPHVDIPEQKTTPQGDGLRKARLIISRVRMFLEQGKPVQIKELVFAEKAHEILVKREEEGLSEAQLVDIRAAMAILPKAMKNVELASHDLDNGGTPSKKQAQAALQSHNWLTARGGVGLSEKHVALCEEFLRVGTVLEKIAKGLPGEVSAEDAQKVRIFNKQMGFTLFGDNVGGKLERIVLDDMKRREEAEALKVGKQLQAVIGTWQFDFGGKPVSPGGWASNHVHRLFGTPGRLSGGPWYSAAPSEVGDFKEAKGLKRVVFTVNSSDGIWYTSTHDYSDLKKIG